MCIAGLCKAVGKVLLGAKCILMCLESVYVVYVVDGCNVVAIEHVCRKCEQWCKCVVVSFPSCLAGFLRVCLKAKL